MQELTFQNALRLHFDSIVLYQNSSFPSAYCLSVLALEEVGKTSHIQSFVGDLQMYAEDLVDLKQFVDSLYSHPAKQRIFASDLLFDFPQDFLKKLNGATLDTLKQNSIYVGFQRRKDIKSKLRSPSSVRRETARKLITIVNDYLIVLTNSVSEGIYTWNTPNRSSLFSAQLSSQLQATWKHRGRLMYSQLRRLQANIRQAHNQ
jgi:AbiV family abortive infection protein